MNLYAIEQSLQQLVDLREQAEADGDSEAIAVIDGQLREYLTQEAAKVTSYVALIRSRQALVDACNAEMERVVNICDCAQADIDRLKVNALAVMQRFGVKELKATPGGGLRIQGNGGVQALEVYDNIELRDEFKQVTVTLPLRQWQAMQQAFEDDPGMGSIYQRPAEPDTERIRAALAQRVVCPECKGGDVPGGECPTCEGAGTIPATVPGAKLLPRGESLRVL